jgi:hypothetical protein
MTIRETEREKGVCRRPTLRTCQLPLATSLQIVALLSTWLRRDVGESARHAAGLEFGPEKAVPAIKQSTWPEPGRGMAH